MGRFRTRRHLAAPLAGALFAVVLAACSGSSAPAASAAPAASSAPVLTGAAAGQVVFEQSCAACHGAAGVGSKFTKDDATIEVPAVNFAALSDIYKDKFDTLAVDGIVKGLDETGQPLNRMMPRWTIFSDQQLADIVTYLKSLK